MRTVIACLILFFTAAFVAFRYVDRNRAQPFRELSKMMYVKAVLSDELWKHYQQHGAYPHSLDDLPLHIIRWGEEGSSVRDISAWFYVSSGTNFTMTWTNARGVEVYLGGDTGRVYYSRDEVQ